MKTCVLVLALFGLAAPAATQPTFLPIPLTQRAWPEPNPTGAFGKCVAGHLTGAGYPDAVMLQNGKPTLFASLAVHNALAVCDEAPSGCTAIATRRRARGPSTRWLDQLVCANGAGLWHWSLTESNSMVWDAVPGSAGWASVAQMIAAEVSGDAIEDIIGVDADQYGVRVWISADAGYGNLYTRTFSHQVLAVAAIDWDVNATTPRALAVATTAGVEICTVGTNLPTLAAISGTSATKATLVTARRSVLIGQTTVFFEFLALTAYHASNWVLRPIMPSVTVPPDSIPLPGLDIVACVAGDIDADDDDDLSYGQRHNHRCTVLLNRSPNNYLFACNATDAVELPLLDPMNPAASAAANSTNGVTHVFADLDGDACADLIHPIESTKNVAVSLNPFGDRSVRVSSATVDIGSPTTELNLVLHPRTDQEVLLTPEEATHWTVTVRPILFVAGSNSFTPNGAPILTSLVAIPEESGTKTVTVSFTSGLLGGSDRALLVQACAVQVLEGEIERTFKPASYIFLQHEGYPGTVPTSPMWTVIQSYIPAHLATQPYHHVSGIGSSAGGQIPVVPPPPLDPPPPGPG